MNKFSLYMNKFGLYISKSSYLQAVWFSCTDELRHQEVGVEKVHVLI